MKDVIIDIDLFEKKYNQLTDLEQCRILNGYIQGHAKATKTLCEDLVKWIEQEILLNPHYKDSPRLKEGANIVKTHIESLKPPKE